MNISGSLRSILLAIACSLIIIAPELAIRPSSATAATSTTKLMLALGDSLAAGYQPQDGQLRPPTNPSTGYPDTGYPGSYPADIAQMQHLKLTDLGCPGETSTSFLGTPAKTSCASIYRNEFGARSQMAAARAFLGRHRGAVKLVTIDIGSNDMDRCLSTTGANFACALSAEATLQHNFTTIFREIKGAVHTDDPTARIFTMNYYDPFLALAYRPGGKKGMTSAAESLIAVNAFNAQVAIDARSSRIPIANVASAFKINSVIPTATYGSKRLPMDVVTDCRLTWMCLLGAGRQDIHPNLTGYKAIASAFARILP